MSAKNNPQATIRDLVSQTNHSYKHIGFYDAPGHGMAIVFLVPMGPSLKDALLRASLLDARKQIACCAPDNAYSTKESRSGFHVTHQHEDKIAELFHAVEVLEKVMACESDYAGRDGYPVKCLILVHPDGHEDVRHFMRCGVEEGAVAGIVDSPPKKRSKKT